MVTASGMMVVVTSALLNDARNIRNGVPILSTGYTDQCAC